MLAVPCTWNVRTPSGLRGSSAVGATSMSPEPWPAFALNLLDPPNRSPRTVGVVSRLRATSRTSEHEAANLIPLILGPGGTLGLFEFLIGSPRSKAVGPQVNARLAEIR